MNRAQTTLRRHVGRGHAGLSLLEVIVATGILATSSVMLLGVLSSGERHAKQAERRVLGQMLCQSKLDEALSSPHLPSKQERAPISGFPGWVYSIREMPLETAGLVRLEVSVTRLEPGRERNRIDSWETRKTFELTRLVRKTVTPTTSEETSNSDGSSPFLTAAPP